MTEHQHPSFYVHFEFGMSWTPRHAPRSRQVTYMSKNMRDRANLFPRQLPPTNTNFLAAPGPQQYPFPEQQQQPQHQAYQQAAPPAQPQHQQASYNYNQHDYSQQQYTQQYQQAAQAQQRQHQNYRQQNQQESEDRRGSRSQSRGSHERGSSAPPPFNGSPWDAEPEPMMASALPRSSRTRAPRPHVWKALPATPDQFRLGEDNLPWDYNFPQGFIEDGEETASDATSTRREYPAESSRRRDVDDRDRGQTKEMQSLATAMLTVDNGFEDQWWYQGPRLITIAGDLFAQTPVQQSRDGTVGWAVAREDRQYQHQQQLRQESILSPGLSAVDIVSPVSDFSSPMSSYQGLRRSLTTRSDELHM